MPFYEKISGPAKASSSRSKRGPSSSGIGSMAAIAGLQQGLGNRGMHRLIAQLKRDPSKAIQRMGGGPEEEELQLKRDPAHPVQRKSNGIPDGVLQKMEASFGTSFADVNVHVGAEASKVGALAYTQGNDIHFAPGQYRPESRSGQELLGHELAHVVQQREGRVKPNAEVAGVPLNDDTSLEAEADRLGAKAAAGR